MKVIRHARLWLLLSLGACAVDVPPPIVPRAEASQAAPGTWTPTIVAPVVDLSGRVSAAGEARITRALEAHRAATRVQIAVLIVDTLGGEPIEDFSLRVAENWGGGSAARDDGMLVTFAAADRRMRIEVGYGLEAQVPDTLAKQFLDDAKPDLRAGDWDAAVEGVVRRLVTQTANGAPSPADYVPRAVREARKGQATVALGLLAAVLAVFAGYATGLGFRPERSEKRGKAKATRRKKGNRRKKRPAPSGRRRVAYQLAWPALLLVLFALVRAFGLTAWTLAPSLVYGLLALPFGLDSEKFVTALKFFAGFGMVMGLGPALAVGLGAGAADGGLAAFAGIGLFTGLMGLAASGVDASSGGGSSYSSSHSSSSTSNSSSSSTSYGASSSSSSYSGGGGSYGGGGASSSW